MYQIKENYHIMTEQLNADNRLSANEKLLCTYILSLSQKYGYCFARNKYFAERYNVSTRSIIRWIKKLENIGYIKKELIFENSVIKERRIFPTQMYVENKVFVSKPNKIFNETRKEHVLIEEEIVTFEEERLIRQNNKEKSKRAEYDVHKCHWSGDKCHEGTDACVTGGGDTGVTVYNNTSMFNNINYIRESEENKTKKINNGTPTNSYPNIQQIYETIKKYDIKNVDAEVFFNYHEARGWKLGGDKIYNWVALLKTWEKRGNTGGKNHAQAGFKVFCEQKSYKEMKFERPDWLPSTNTKLLTDAEIEKALENMF